MFPPSNYKILINQVFLTHWGFDALITAPRFWHLVSFSISGLRHPYPYTKVWTPCFLLHIGVSTPCFLLHIGVTTPWSLHQGLDTLFSSAYRGYDILIPTTRSWHLIPPAHRDYDTQIPTPRFRQLIFLAYQGYDILILLPRFRHLASLAYRGHDTLILTPWFLHLVFLFKSRFLHFAKVFTPCFLLFKSKFQHPAKVSTPCFSSLKICLLMSEHLVTYLLQPLLSFQKLHFKILRISSYVLHNSKFNDWKRGHSVKKQNFKKAEHNNFFIMHSYISGSWSLQ